MNRISKHPSRIFTRNTRNSAYAGVGIRKNEKPPPPPLSLVGSTNPSGILWGRFGCLLAKFRAKVGARIHMATGLQPPKLRGTNMIPSYPPPPSTPFIFLQIRLPISLPLLFVIFHLMFLVMCPCLLAALLTTLRRAETLKMKNWT